MNSLPDQKGRNSIVHRTQSLRSQAPLWQQKMVKVSKVLKKCTKLLLKKIKEKFQKIVQDKRSLPYQVSRKTYNSNNKRILQPKVYTQSDEDKVKSQEIHRSYVVNLNHKAANEDDMSTIYPMSVIEPRQEHRPQTLARKERTNYPKVIELRNKYADECENSACETLLDIHKTLDSDYNETLDSDYNGLSYHKLPNLFEEEEDDDDETFIKLMRKN